ncbi:MAG: Sbal_3080 family lipoprotein [Proteobacteria bacterium]|nr:Sbal_3080 family lipoprotein [Pseudomonadota bacterium]MCL2306935.1 Sbal_3080 family lipoprotein [Pseudomonadota bacterium]
MPRRILIVALLPVISACTSIQVTQVDPDLGMKHVCIRENPDVKVSDFIQVLQEGFARHGVTTEVFSKETGANCEFILTYTALRSWDFKPYLSHAEIRIEKGGKKIAEAEYHLAGGGGLALTKWAGTKEKIDPVIDELFKKPESRKKRADAF